jgi:hypothetical protein
MQSATTLLLRDVHRAAIAATISVLVVAGLWPFAFAVLLPYAWSWARRLVRRQRASTVRFPSAHRVSGVLNVITAVALLIAVVTVVTSDPDRWSDPARTRDPIGNAAPWTPDIYIIWLDAYPALDTLRNAFGYDNRAFVGELEERGFEVATQSRSNYASTWLTMSSMFHMEYVDAISELTPPAADTVDQFKQLRRAVNNAPAMDRLRQAGYTVVSSQGAFTDAGFSNAEVVLDDGQLNQFEEQMMRLTMVGAAVDLLSPDWFASQARTRITSSFAHIHDMVRRSEPAGPIALIAQVMAPHAPFVWNADGSPAPAPDCHPARCFLWETEIDDLQISEDEYRRRLVGHLRFTNSMVLRIIDTVIAERPDSVVIVLSDHGTRSDLDRIDEFFRNIFASRTPGHANVFPEDVSPVNMFPYLFGAYFGDDPNAKSYQAWYASTTKPLDLTRYR